MEEKAQQQIAKLRGQITQVKQLVDKTCPTKCAFALMRLASAKSVSKNKKKSKKPERATHSTAICAGIRDKQDSRNAVFLNRVTSGQVTLNAPKTNSQGKLIRPAAVTERHTAARRIKAVTRGLLDAAKSDGATLVWLIRSLYQQTGLTRAFQVALLDDCHTVFLSNCAA